MELLIEQVRIFPFANRVPCQSGYSEVSSIFGLTLPEREEVSTNKVQNDDGSSKFRLASTASDSNLMG